MALGVARRGRPVLAGAMLVLAGLVLAVAWTMQQLAGGIALGGWRCLNGLAGLVLLGLLCVGAALTIDDRGGRLAVYGCSLSIVVLVVPLAFVNPVGPRCFYCTYFVLLVLAGLVFTGPLAAEVPRLRPALTAVATAAAVALFAGYFAVYGVVTHAADRRIERVRAEVAAGATTVHLRPLPFGDYVHEPDPKPGVDTGGFKAFYHLPRTLRIVLVRA
jgi:hypothetical protein